MIADIELLEKSRIKVDDEGKAFLLRGILIPFDAILHIELSTQKHEGATDVAAWQEQRAVARIITEPWTKGGARRRVRAIARASSGTG